MMKKFKIISKFKSVNKITGMSLITLTNGLKKAIGDVELAKVLQERSLFIKCEG